MCNANILLAATLIALLVSCGKAKQEPVWNSNSSNLLPNAERISFSPANLPAALSARHILPTAVDQEKADALNAKANFPFPKTESGEQPSLKAIAARRHDRASGLGLGDPQFEEQTVVTDFADYFDPFNYGSTPNANQNNTESACGASRDGEPGNILRWNNSFCIVGVIKIALHRAVTHYDNFHRVLVAVAENLALGENEKGTETTYTNAGVDTIRSSGVIVRVFFDNCSQHRVEATADPDAFSYCLGEVDDTLYHRLKIYPLNPTSSAVTVNSVIGKMEWLLQPDSSMQGEMAISNSLMSGNQATILGYAPPQMQFDFRTDATGDFRSFGIKFAPRTVLSSSASRELTWEANVFRVTRSPSDGLWSVQGSILTELDIGTNPLRNDQAFNYEPSHTTNRRVYFAGVSEDIFVGGLSVYKAIMADSNGGGIMDYNTYSSDQWDTELHLWSSYKKLLMQNFSEAHYKLGHGMNGPPVRVWDSASANQITFDGVSVGAASIRSVDMTADASQILLTHFGVIQVLNVVKDVYGGTDFESVGSCQPFAPNTRLTNSTFNPVNSSQILVGDRTGWTSPEGTDEVRLIDVSNIASGDCPIIRAFYHPPYDGRSQSIYRVGFSPDGSQIFASILWGDNAVVWDVNDNTAYRASAFLSRYSPNSMAFDSTGTRLISSHGDHASYVFDITSGNVLKLHDDTTRVTSGNFNYRQFTSFNNPNFTDQIITTRVGTPFGNTTENMVYRWDISSWTPTSGNDTWVTTDTTPHPNLLQVFTFTHEDNRKSSINHGTINNNGEQIIFSGTSQSSILPVSSATGEIINTPRSNRGVLAYPIFSADGLDLFFAKGTSSMARIDPNNPSLSLPFQDVHVGAANSAILSQDNKHALSAGVDGRAIIWNMSDGLPLQTFDGHSDEISSAIFTRNGSRILTASDDNTARLWDADITSAEFGTTLVTFTGHTSPVNNADYDNNFSQHRIATSSNDGSVRIYDDTGGLISSFTDLFGGSAVLYIDFSSDGLFLAASSSSSDIVIIDTDPDSATAYQILATISDHSGAVQSVMFYPSDSTRILTTSSDFSSRVFNIANVPVTGTYFQEIRIPRSGRIATVSNQLRALITSTGSGYGSFITQWDIDPASSTYGSRFSSSVNPLGAPTFNNEYFDPRPQNRSPLYSAFSSADGSLVIAADEGSLFRPSWVDFENYFSVTDGSGFRIRPDERDEINPLYVEPVVIGGGCFEWNTSTRSCEVNCSQVGGCNTFQVNSAFSHLRNGTTPSPQFADLINRLEQLEVESPLTNGYLMEQYVSQPID